MTADTIGSLIEALGPIGAVLAVLLFLLFKPQFTQSSTPPRGFDAEQKLYLKEKVVETIVKAVKE